MASKEKEELSYTYTDRELVILGQNQQYIEELICPVCLGCEVVVEREQLEKHSEASKDEHLRLAMEKVMELSCRRDGDNYKMWVPDKTPLYTQTWKC